MPPGMLLCIVRQMALAPPTKGIAVDPVSLILMLCIGNVAGWLATMYVKGGEARLLVNVAAGVIGAFAAGLPVGYLFPYWGFLAAGSSATLGAAAFLVAAHRLGRARSRGSTEGR